MAVRQATWRNEQRVNGPSDAGFGASSRPGPRGGLRAWAVPADRDTVQV